MTLTETLIGGILLAIFTGVLGMLVGNRKKVTTDEFERHRTSDSPHIACPVHKRQLDEVEKKIDKLDVKVDLLLER